MNIYIYCVYDPLFSCGSLIRLIHVCFTGMCSNVAMWKRPDTFCLGVLHCFATQKAHTPQIAIFIYPNKKLMVRHHMFGVSDFRQAKMRGNGHPSICCAFWFQSLQ